jgi:hypothetical protein
MNPKAVVHSMKSICDGLAAPSIEDLDRLLRESGMSAEQVKKLLETGYKGIVPPAPDPSVSNRRWLEELRTALSCDD